MDTKSLTKMAKSLSDPHRLLLLKEIAKGTNRGCADLFEFVPISQPSMSQHLKSLAESGLIESHKEGRNMRLAINDEKLEELTSFLQSLKIA
ncbi:helix-turn-helix transcriptional regulator [Dyadobacter sp. CY326]|uniref:ArsR/SmtB family transcription factor n=1 Tax=Dyadobacter sp. CY326 TaxID=2907300 RepID=UPI001F2BE561|nr:metalloregulator ArsR/SmtB family transcription factor [Dyadobacter sp. CY326]MCE7065206.1 metalloregulator ArsR/SmtB family transcription factor [Dyadobacter sp. CY326]